MIKYTEFIDIFGILVLSLNGRYLRKKNDNRIKTSYLLRIKRNYTHTRIFVVDSDFDNNIRKVNFQLNANLILI